MRIVITGSQGFIAQNLRVHLQERGHTDVVGIDRQTSAAELSARLTGADFVFHLAGVNRPKDVSEFEHGNAGFTQALCTALAALPKPPPVVFTSSTQAALDNLYGLSKRQAEDALLAYARTSGSRVHLLRLPNVFGKWSRPNYNSAVATFCHNISRGLPVTVNNPAAPLRLIYVDDLMAVMLKLLDPAEAPASGFADAQPVYETTVGELAQTIRSFPASRTSLVTPRVGRGLVRALYATYVSMLPTEAFGYGLVRHADPRGVFVEMLKTPDCGQFSYFTAHPGITRGEHYHHTKTEKFLVIKGQARFGFRHILSNETYELAVSGELPEVVESIPGWSHKITNIGSDEMVVMLWANEIFDRQLPDTVAMKVAP